MAAVLRDVAIRDAHASDKQASETITPASPVSQPKRPWQDIAKQVQDYRDSTINAITPAVPEVPSDLPLNVTPFPSQLLTEDEIKITEMLPEQLLPALATGKLTSVQVTKAFLRRAGLAQKLTNCLTEALSATALARAEYCDKYLSEHGKPIGPLHGLPISVKEHISMKGLTLNCSFVAWAEQIGTEDANILKLLYNAGAVFHVRTTGPQLLMHLETASNLYGATVNPYNTKLTSGGSSGGEGALLGMRGSCLGIGTDIGGSIRSPAANCGVYGFRPTSYRLPNIGAHAPGLGEEQVVPVIGPLSTSLAGCRLFMEVLIGARPWLIEPQLLPFKWDYGTNHLVQRHGRTALKVGVLWHDGVVKPHPPVRRALEEMVERLRRVEGVSVVDWEPYKHDEGWDIISSLYFCDNGNEDRELVDSAGEPWLPLSKFIIHEQKGDETEEDNASTIWKKTVRREEYRGEYLRRWNATGDKDGHPVDVILCPVGPGAAPPLNNSRYWPYTSTWNLLDYPALVFPFTKVDQEKDKREEGYTAINAQDEFNYKLYDPEVYRDAPVSLQLVGRRYEDEKVFQAMEFIKHTCGV